jgi:DNA-binding transcriptional ArsR family regulator
VTLQGSSFNTLNLDQAEAVADRFRVLADPTRVRLLCALAQRELCVSELTDLLGMEQSAVSHQLRTLRGYGLVDARKEGRLVYYRLCDSDIRRWLSQSVTELDGVSAG